MRTITDVIIVGAMTRGTNYSVLPLALSKTFPRFRILTLI
jgi:hypothetical protein